MLSEWIGLVGTGVALGVAVAIGVAVGVSVGVAVTGGVGLGVYVVVGVNDAVANNAFTCPAAAALTMRRPWSSPGGRNQAKAAKAAVASKRPNKPPLLKRGRESCPNPSIELSFFVVRVFSALRRSSAQRRPLMARELLGLMARACLREPLL